MTRDSNLVGKMWPWKRMSEYCVPMAMMWMSYINFRSAASGWRL